MSPLSILFLFVFLIVLPCSPALSELCNPQDKQALLQIKKELGNTATLSTWLPTTDCCQNKWVGVTCGTKAQAYRVQKLKLEALTISKPYPFPPSIGNLPYLDSLIIDGASNLVGTIPSTITKLNRLTDLEIRNTNLSGQVPNFLSRIKTLEFFDLSYNKFSGNLPPWLPSLPNLSSFYLDNNRFTGTIPDSYGSFSKSLTFLSLSSNILTGKIPASLGNLNLEYVYLNGNKLEGDASMFFGSQKQTKQIYLAHNLFSFDLGKVEIPNTLHGLIIDHNRIYGEIPKGLASIPDLFTLDVSYNKLCGEIPQAGNLQDFEESAYAGNKCLCGSPLPACKHF